MIYGEKIVMILKKLNPFGSVKENADKIISNTEKFIETVDQQVIGNETVSVMINGEKIELNQNNYIKLKESNNLLKRVLKDNIKNSAKEYKESLKMDLADTVKHEKSKKS